MSTTTTRDLYCTGCGRPDSRCICDPRRCGKCLGRGYLVDCLYARCHAQGWCEHTGPSTCPTCGGEGTVQPTRVSPTSIQL